MFLYFLVPWWHRPRTSLLSFHISSHLPQSFAFPTYDCVLQQHCGTYSPTAFCCYQAAGKWPNMRGVIQAVRRVGVSLYGSVSCSLSTAWTLGVILCGYGNIYHFRAKDGWVKNLGETTERTEGGTGGQWRGRGVGVWTVIGWCRASIGHCRRQPIIRTKDDDWCVLNLASNETTIRQQLLHSE